MTALRVTDGLRTDRILYEHAVRSVESDLLLRDLRHMSARAAPDLADWLVHLELEGKAARTVYAYTRAIAPLLRANKTKTLAMERGGRIYVGSRVPEGSRSQLCTVSPGETR